jgi:hypothetical protein
VRVFPKSGADSPYELAKKTDRIFLAAYVELAKENGRILVARLLFRKQDIELKNLL